MGIKKKAIGILCASLIGLNAVNCSATPGINSEDRQKIAYDYDEFFREDIKSQNTLEELISYNYSRYNTLFRKIKSIVPEETTQDLIKNSYLIHWIRFFILRYSKYPDNLGRLGYELEKIVPKGDNISVFLHKKDSPRDFFLEIDLNLDSPINYISTDEMKKFLNGNESYISKIDEEGNLVYRIIKSGK